MPGYIFLFDEAAGVFPERYRVVSDDENADAIRRAEGLTGTIPEAAADALLSALTDRFPPGHPTRAEMVKASNWQTVRRNYAGLFRD